MPAGLTRNVNGVAQYPKGDVRRALAVIAAIDYLQGATLVELARFTGYNKGSLPGYLQQAEDQMGVTINKAGPRYRLASWGPMLNAEGVRTLVLPSSEPGNNTEQ